MQRRTLLRYGFRGALLGAGSFLLPRTSSAEIGCSQPQQTPYGPMRRCTAGVSTDRFGPVSAYQERDEWCWAACISMVFAFYGFRVSQTRIVTEIWGEAVNMPGQPEHILRDLNRPWVDDHGRHFRSQGDALSANNFNAVVDLRQGMPLIIGALGHATVLTALTGDTNLQTGQWQIVEAVVRDPWPSNGGRRTLSPQEWFNIRFAARVRVQG